MAYAMIPHSMHVPGTIPQHAMYAPHPAMPYTGTSNQEDCYRRLACVLDMIAYQRDPQLCARALELCCKFRDRCAVPLNRAWGSQESEVQPGCAGATEGKFVKSFDNKYFEIDTKETNKNFFQQLTEVLENITDGPDYLWKYMNENLPSEENDLKMSPTAVLLQFVLTNKAFVVFREHEEDLLYFAPSNYDPLPATYAVVKWNKELKRFENHDYVKFYDEFEKIEENSGVVIRTRTYFVSNEEIFLQQLFKGLEKKYSTKEDRETLSQGFLFCEQIMKFFGLDFIRDIKDKELWRYFPRQTETVYEKLVQFNNFMFKELSIKENYAESIYFSKAKNLLLKFATNGIILFKDEGLGWQIKKSKIQKAIDENLEIVRTILSQDFTACKPDERRRLMWMKFNFNNGLIRAFMFSSKDKRVELLQSFFKMDIDQVETLLQKNS